MRKILFRGKADDTKDWFMGDLISHTYEKPNIRPIRTLNSYIVIPETVGQFTGLTDNNNQKIFEGDIVSFRRCNALGYTTMRVGTVYYGDNYPAFYIEATTGDSWCFSEVEDVEVIGNWYDNPELLKGEADEI